MSKPLVTILIPNYKTLELSKLCLRLIRKNTDFSKAQVIVIDNDSQDDSLHYLRSLSWIDLIERPAVPGETGPQAHAAALDLGLARTVTPYVLSIHTDTLVKHPQWLDFLINEIEKNILIAGVGSWKLEFKSVAQRFSKTVETVFQKMIYSCVRKNDHHIEGVGKNYFYLRSHCAMYRTHTLHDLGLNFSAEGEVAGKVMHKKLEEQGYQMRFLPPEELVQYLEHLNHATMVLNPEFHEKRKQVDKGLKRIQQGLKRVNADLILSDHQWDT